MPRLCTICHHPDREAIDKALIAGEPFRNIAKRTGTSPTALFRHKSDHLAASLIKAKEAADLASADSVLQSIRDQLGQITRLDTSAEEILNQAKKSRDLRTALRAIRELSNLHREKRATLELVARITGELEQAKQPGQGGAILILPPQLPPGAPCILDREYWEAQGFHGPATRPALPPGSEGQIVEAKVEEIPPEEKEGERKRPDDRNSSPVEREGHGDRLQAYERGMWTLLRIPFFSVSLYASTRAICADAGHVLTWFAIALQCEGGDRRVRCNCG